MRYGAEVMKISGVTRPSNALWNILVRSSIWSYLAIKNIYFKTRISRIFGPEGNFYDIQAEWLIPDLYSSLILIIV